MRKYRCNIANLSEGWVDELLPSASYRVETSKEAFDAFVNDYGELREAVEVRWGLANYRIFECKGFRSEQERLALQKEEADKHAWKAKLEACLSGVADKSYFQLKPEQREGFASLVIDVATEFEKRALSEIEVRVVEAWSTLKGRKLGEALVTALKASRSKEERGNSSAVNAALLMSALQYRKLDFISQDLHEMADDVDTVSGLVQED